MKFLATVLIVFVICNCAYSQSSNVKIGAYYFDGWTGTFSYHLTPQLTSSFSNRKPIWGWITSTQDIMNKQIDAAADAGLSFFSFCWYYNGKSYNNYPLNRAFSFYRSSPENSRLKYCLLVVNTKGFEIHPKDWPILTGQWLKYFSDNQYLKINNKPIIIFYTAKSLVDEFGSEQKVKEALDSLRSEAVKKGLSGLQIVACSSPNQSQVTQIENCGFDALTGYNYHNYGFRGFSKKQVPIDTLIKSTSRVWDGFAKISSLPYIPSSTLNWDPRPWATLQNNYSNAPYFVGYSSKSVESSINEIFKWVKSHPNETLTERIALLYAWNEYGEGAWLTPSANSSDNLLDGVKRAIKAQ